MALQEDEMLSSKSSWAEPTTSDATVRTWVRTPFGTRGERTRPTRPYVEHGHEAARHQPPPLV
jgi:hypothetical protein